MPAVAVGHDVVAEPVHELRSCSRPAASPSGTTWSSTALPFGLAMTGLTCCDVGVVARSPRRSCVIAATSPATSTSLATSSGPLKPGPEALARAGRTRGAVVNFVGSLPASATPSRSETNGTARIDEDQRAADRGRPRPAPAARGSSAPRSSARASRCFRGARQRQLVDRVADEAEHRGQQRDRGGHHEQHRERRADRQPADERHADQEQAEQRDHDRAAGEQHRAAARVDRVHDRLLRGRRPRAAPRGSACR